MKALVALAILLLAPVTSRATAAPGTEERHACAATPPSSEASAEQDKAGARLDLDSLERRLRETKAIGFFTKLSLKNQVDDLVDQFRRFHNRISNATLGDLRQRYNLLFLKVLSLLQDADPPLSRDIAASREAIWDLLADPEKFRKLTKEVKS